MNWELPDVQAGFQRDTDTRNQIANICWIMEKTREFQKNIYSGSKLGKEYVKDVYRHPAYLNFMQSTSCEMQNAGLDEAQAEIKIARRNINSYLVTSVRQMTPS